MTPSSNSSRSRYEASVSPGRDAMRSEAPREPGHGARREFGRLVGDRRGADGEFRQDRLAAARPEGAALGDLDGRGERLGKVGEQRRHLGAALEIVLRGELPALGLGDQPALGDADQRVVRLMVLADGKIGLVGGDQRNPACIGEIEQAAFGLTLDHHAVALQLDIEPVAEQFLHLPATRLRDVALPGREGEIETTGQDRRSAR